MPLTTVLHSYTHEGKETYCDEIDTTGLTDREVWEKCVDVSNAHTHDDRTHVKMIYTRGENE